MSLPRSPRCRSALHPARFARCIGCGADARNRPTVLREGEGDSTRAVGILVAVGALGIVRAFTGLHDGGLMLLACAAGFMGVFALVPRTLEGRATAAGPTCLRLAAALTPCGVALQSGLGVLVGFVCLEAK